MKRETIEIQALRRVAEAGRQELWLLVGLCLLAGVLLSLDVPSPVPLIWAVLAGTTIIVQVLTRSRLAREDRVSPGAHGWMICAGLVNSTLFASLPVWLVLVHGDSMTVPAAMMLAAAAVRVMPDFSICRSVGAANLGPLVLVPGASLALSISAAPSPDWVHLAMSLTAVAGFTGYLFAGWMLRDRAERDLQASLEQLRHTEDDLRASKERIEHAVRAFGTVAWSVDFDRRIAVFSEGAERVFGRIPDFADFDRKVSDLIYPDDRTGVVDAMRAIRTQSGPITLEHRLLRPDGSVRWVRTTGSCRRAAPGQRGEIVMMTIDITAARTRDQQLSALLERAGAALASRRQLLDEFGPAVAGAAPSTPGTTPEGDLFGQVGAILTEIDASDLSLAGMVRQLRGAQVAAESASRAKSEFLANMSHELRTPLNAIIGYSEILEEDLTYDGQEDRAADSRKVRDSARHLLRLINEILDLSRLDAGTLDLEARPLALGRALDAALADHAAAAAAKGLELVVSDRARAALVVADPRHLAQCLSHLIGNAVKFTATGSVQVDVATGGASAGHVDIEVRDTGVGIAADAAARLFDAFTQADGSTTRRHGGTGMGLAITQRLARLMGGDVLVAAAQDGGSVFTLRLPILCDTVLVQEAEASDPRTVLIVEDDPVATDLAVKAAAGLGLRTACARTGGAALDHAARHTPALVVLDLDLPDLNGLEVLAALRGQDATRATPVLVVSALDARRAAIQAGAREFLLKPCGAAVIAAAIARCLGPGLAPPSEPSDHPDTDASPVTPIPQPTEQAA
jgi:PAS domain S-box-containing protein